MKKLISIIVLPVIIGCVGPRVILLVHPRSGELVKCTPYVGQGYVGEQPSTLRADALVRDCAQQYEALGYIRAENLTPEQKATITPRTYPIEQDITIREGQPKK